MSNTKMTDDDKPNLIGELARIFGSCAGSALLHSLSGGRVTLLPASNPVVPPPLQAPVLASLSPAPLADPSPEPVDSPKKTDVEATEEVMPLAKQPVKRLRPGEPSGPWEYAWVESSERFDFVGQGMLTYRGKPYLALEIILQDIVIARVALAPTECFTAFHTLGMRLSTTGEQAPRCERVKFDRSEETWGFRVEAGPLDKLVPKIYSLKKALCLHKRGKALPLPEFPGPCAPEKQLSFDREDDSYSAVPFVVRIERRRTTEPIVHVQWFLICPRGEDGFDYRYGGRSLMSWRDAVTLGKYGTLYAKVILPERDALACFPPGSWCPVRVEGVSTRSGKNEFAEALVLDREGIPKEIQEFTGRSKDVQTVPLNMDRLHAYYRKSWGFALRDE